MNPCGINLRLHPTMASGRHLHKTFSVFDDNIARSLLMSEQIFYRKLMLGERKKCDHFFRQHLDPFISGKPVQADSLPTWSISCTLGYGFANTLCALDDK
jgi:hypothetical protein